MHLPPFYTGITIGFERMSYTFSEERPNPSVRDEVFIIKQNNQASELTYNITIQSFMGTALRDSDFRAIAAINEIFTPEQQRVPIHFQILPDDVPEELETFTFRLRNNDLDTPFTIDPQQATIFINDTDSKCCTTQASHGLHADRRQCMCSKRQCMEWSIVWSIQCEHGTVVNALRFRNKMRQQYMIRNAQVM